MGTDCHRAGGLRTTVVREDVVREDRVMAVSYPRLAARTLRFTLGIPRNITISPDGKTVRFIRTPDGMTRTGQLWEFDVDSGEESLLVDPLELLGSATEELSDEEKARRERSRESAAGLVSYHVDPTGRWACFSLSGKLWAIHLGAKAIHELPAEPGVVDPQLDPTGRRIAYASGSELRVIEVNGTNDRLLVAPETETEVWGQADFIAAEEMSRFHGFWWAPDGKSLLVQHNDDAPVPIWHISDPENPERKPRTQRYPAAGTSNTIVRLWHIELTGEHTEVVWDRERFEYLARVSWNAHGPAVIQVLSRDQRTSQIIAVDPKLGATKVIRELTDGAWVELASTPQYAPGGRLVTLEDINDRRRVVVDGEPISDVSWQIRSIVKVRADEVIATASTEPTHIQVVRFGLDRTATPLTSGDAVHSAVISGTTTVISRSSASQVRSSVTVTSDGGDTRSLRVLQEPAPFEPQVHWLRLGEQELRAGVVFPRHHVAGSTKLPILMDPYGGPHAQRVLASARAFLEPQWLADQGFCVVVCDGRGSPGRGHHWERSILHSFATVTLEDQVTAVQAVGELFGDEVDLDRVAISGWSYGGYLAALAVLERPDIFHAAVAGAPVTDWRLYDTCYTERYLGHPDVQPQVYDENSLLNRASRLNRPLMLIHGLADDNVVAAHTLKLSSALLAAGRAHTVLPLSGVTHMTPQEVVAENLKLLQVDFLKKALNVVD